MSSREWVICCISPKQIPSHWKQIYVESILWGILWRPTNYHMVWYLAWTEWRANATRLQLWHFQRVSAYHSVFMLWHPIFQRFKWIETPGKTNRPLSHVHCEFFIKRFTERMASQSQYSSTTIQIQLKFKRQGVWRHGADKAIDLTILWFNEIEHNKSIVGYVNKDIALPHCYTVFVLAMDSIQGKPTLMGVKYGGRCIMAYCL